MCPEQRQTLILIVTMGAAVAALVGCIVAAVSLWLTRKRERFTWAFRFGQDFNGERMRRIRSETARVMINEFAKMDAGQAKAEALKKETDQDMSDETKQHKQDAGPDHFHMDMYAAGAEYIWEFFEAVGLAVVRKIADRETTWELLGARVREYWAIWGDGILGSRQNDPVFCAHFERLQGDCAKQDAKLGRKFSIDKQRFLLHEALQWPKSSA